MARCVRANREKVDIIMRGNADINQVLYEEKPVVNEPSNESANVVWAKLEEGLLWKGANAGGEQSKNDIEEDSEVDEMVHLLARQGREIKWEKSVKGWSNKKKMKEIKSVESSVDGSRWNGGDTGRWMLWGCSAQRESINMPRISD